MTRIESNRVEIESPAEKIYDFLGNFSNYEKIMPEQVANWQSTADECSFTIKGMASIGMKIAERIASSEIRIVSGGKSPFAFTLACFIENIMPGRCAARLVFEAELNPMMQMMVHKPLQNFFNLLAGKLKDVHNVSS